MTRVWHWAPWFAFAAVLAPLAACAAYPGASARYDAGFEQDARPTLGSDSGAADGAVMVPRDGGSSGVDAGSPESDRNDPGLYAAACLDGRELDCANPSCAYAASCCVGVASAACCTITSPPSSFVFQCTTGSCDTLTSFTTFGAPGPTLTTDGAYAPASDLDSSDSGAILTTPVDPRAAIVTVSATLGVPTTTSNTDAIGIGLVAGGPSAHVVPLAAIVVSAARHQTLLLVGETIAAALPLASAAMPTYSITVDPSGRVSATDGTGTMTATIPLPASPLHAAFFGRATPPSSGAMLPARIGSFEVSSSGCDQPTALTRMGPITIVDHTSAAILATATDPSVATDGTNVLLAFSAGSMIDGAHGSIFVAVRESDGAFHVRGGMGVTQPIAAPMLGDSLEAPALVDDGGSWTLFATRVHGGVRSLVQLRGGAMHSLAFGAPTDIATPDLVGDVSSPAPLPGDPSRLVARFQASAASSSPELVLLVLASATNTATPSAGICSADSMCTGGARTETRVYASREGAVAFDADDIDDPAIVVFDHVYRLYYAGRLGSRWSVGLAIAADLGYWRTGNAGQSVLGPVGAGFDAVSVRAPAPYVEGGALALYYVGSDGDTSAIGLAQGGAIAP